MFIQLHIPKPIYELNIIYKFFLIGEHVSGSPFYLRVMGAPDASKVRVHGPGIEHGVLATFQSRFLCDTRGAGAGQLTVRVRGPKGDAFRMFAFSYIQFNYKTCNLTTYVTK